LTRLIIVAAASIGLILLVAFFITRLVRSWQRGISIRLQVFIALASVIGAFALGLGVMVLDRIDARSSRFATHNATDKALVIAQMLGGEMTQYGKTLAEVAERLPQRASPYVLDGVMLYDRSHKLLYQSEGGFPGPEAPTVSADVPIFVNGQELGTVRVFKTTLVMERLLKEFAPIVLVISLVLSAAAALAAIWIGHTIAGPIEALSLFAQRVSQGELRVTAPSRPRGREVMRLTQALDSMRRQLEGRPFVEAFAADLSHELKNPVAAIRAAAEVLDDSALEEPEEARRFVRRIREATDRIERLLSELLSLARLEAHGVTDLEIVQLDSLVKASAEAIGDPRISFGELEAVAVRGEPNWLSRAITNLLENALIHSNEPVVVELRVQAPDGLLLVTNSGQVAKHARTRLFRRFFTTRADKGGTGLGLAIVRAVAEAHRGHAELLESGPPKVVFRITLPLA
jgi:signal transduction histidine kinase